MKTQALKISPDMLSLAREYRGMTQKDLAAAASITQPQIAQMENGQTNSASANTINAVIEALGFPIEFFELQETKIGFGSSSVFYRKKSKITAADRRVIQSKVNLHRIALKKMLNAVDIKPTLNLLTVDLESGKTPIDAANLIRSTWNIPDGPIQDLTKLLERAGIVIIECDFGTKYIDGTTIWNMDAPPTIYVNKDLSPDRYRFTIAHELGHLVMHEDHNEDMENQADQFASELLMPKQFFSPYVSRFHGAPKLHELSALKGMWKVSIAAMIERMHQLNFISQEKRKVLYIMMNQQKIRQVEPNSFEKEKPALLEKIFNAAVIDGDIDMKNLSSYFLLPNECVKELYFSLPQLSVKKIPHLRIL